MFRPVASLVACKTFGLAIVVFVCVFAWHGASQIHAEIIAGESDFWSTPHGGGLIPALSNLKDADGNVVLITPVDVPLVGQPTGPGNTDTIVERKTGLAPGATGTIDVELVALSLVSVSPVAIDGGVFDLFVDLDPRTPSLGLLDITVHDDGLGGGLFDSFFDVFARITATPVGGGTSQVFFFDDRDVTGFDGQLHTLAATGVPWSHSPAPDYVAPDNSFFPGVNPLTGLDEGIQHEGPHPQVYAATPEPSALVMLSSLICGMGFVGYRLRRRKMAA